MKYLGAPQSGSQANTTASHNRAGQYYRNRRSPVQPIGTGRRAFIRSAFAAASTAWAALSTADQAAWAGYADGHPITDSLGQSIKLTGHQMFVAIYTQWQNIAETGVPAVPASSTTVAPVVSGFAPDHVDGTFTINFDGTGPAADFILVALSPQLSPGRSFNGRWWQQTVVPGNSGTPVNLFAAYEAEFGTLQSGAKIFYKATPVNQYGVTGTPVVGFAIVT